MKPERDTKKAVLAALAVVALAGCNADHEAKLRDDQSNFAAVVKGQQDGLQWDVDKATAQKLFWRYYSDAPPEPTRDYEVFLKCHDAPPTHDANRQMCAALQARVAKQEAKDDARDKREKAAW